MASRTQMLSLMLSLSVLLTALIAKKNQAFASWLTLVITETWQHVQGTSMSLYHTCSTTLMVVFCLRYSRLVVSIIAFLLYKPVQPKKNPLYRPRDVHVIVSTIDPLNNAFKKCLNSILLNKPSELTIAVGGEQHIDNCNIAIEDLREHQGNTKIRVLSLPGQSGNKRKQQRLVFDHMAQSRSLNEDKIVVLVDDHAWWPNDDFLLHALAPFEDPLVALAGTQKRVLRNKGTNWLESLINFLSCIYLERHNFEVAAQNAIDGGAFVISGRTCILRASIVMDKSFREEYTNEKFFFGRYGPLNPDDDCFITRWVTSKPGFKMVFQYHPKTIMYTTLGEKPDDGASAVTKFRGQLVRWVRSLWRSNPRSLCDPMLWSKYWYWSAPVVYGSLCFNFAAVWDFTMIWLWSKTELPWWTGLVLLFCIIGSKTIKLLPHFFRNPEDWIFFPCYVCFAWLHSFIKLYALATFWNHSWGGRKLSESEEKQESELRSTPTIKDDSSSDPSCDTPPNGLHSLHAYAKKPFGTVVKWKKLSIHSINEDESDSETPPRTPMPFPYDLAKSQGRYGNYVKRSSPTDWQSRMHHAAPMPAVPEELHRRFFDKSRN